MESGPILVTDVLVAGGGIAGYKAALEASKNGLKTLLITKSEITASDHVLGFNAVLSEDDSSELYAQDTLKGGWYINNKELVDVLAQNAASEVKSTEELGLDFDGKSGKYDLLKPLGCTVPRLAHIGNKTGNITLARLKEEAKKLGVCVIKDAMLADVITSDNTVAGAVIYDISNKRISTVSAKAVVIATGGIHITEDSTYFPCMTGDGYGVAYRAGASLTDMEFLQFEPCRCIYPKKLGISTTLLAKGGKITNKNGERFLLESFATEGEIPKDILARLIYAEIQKGNGTQHGGVYMDLTGIDPDEIIIRHSLYYERFKNAGIDITKEKIEVAPCAHSFMGGIVIDKECATSVKGLFAAGEAAGGIHGSNRVGGNAGTEIYVFGTIAGKSASDYCACNSHYNVKSYTPAANENLQDKEYFDDIKKEIFSIMAVCMGPVRTKQGIQKAIDGINVLSEKEKNASALNFDSLVAKKECQNMLIVCRTSCMAALSRKESRGAHYRSDYPETSNEYQRNFVHTR